MALFGQILTLLKSKRAGSAIWNSLEAVIYPFLMLLATPYFIDRLGAELYGIWMLVNTVIASIGILNVGFGDATIKYIVQYEAKNDRHGAHKIIQTNLTIYGLLALIVTAVALVIGYLVKNGIILKVVKDNAELTATVIVIAGATLGLKFIEQIFLAAFKGYDRYDVASQVSMIGKMATIGVNVLMVVSGYSLAAVFIGTFVVTVLMLLLEAYLSYRLLSYKFFRPTIERKLLREVLSFGIWTWSLSVMGLISTQIDKYLVVTLADLTVFAYYSLAFTVFSQFHNLFAASVAWVFPVVSRKIHNNENIVSFYMNLQWGFLSLVAVTLTAVYLVKEPLLRIWLGEQSMVNVIPFVRLFLCLNFVMAATIIPYYFLNGSGYFRLNAYYNVANLVMRFICIPLMYYLIGLQGLVMGLILATMLVFPFQMYSFYDAVLGRKGFSIAVKIIVPFVLFLGVLATSNVFFILLILTAVLVILPLLFKPQLKPVPQ
jgi:O-antigen/teichoic acid export membrane protein